MKAKTRTIAGLFALAVALALPAGSVAATVTHVKGSEHSPSSDICGLSLVTDYTYNYGVIVKASGVTIDTGQFTSQWTNPASGKSIVIHSGEMGMTSAPIDNGDGTISFLGSISGSYMVKDAHGGPITLQAGRLTTRLTLTTAGDFVSVEFLTVSGPHPESADSSCDSIVAALT